MDIVRPPPDPQPASQRRNCFQGRVQGSRQVMTTSLQHQMARQSAGAAVLEVSVMVSAAREQHDAVQCTMLQFGAAWDGAPLPGKETTRAGREAGAGRF
mmetsp:Transcript_67979/g.121042  ORF Transcript_67979/g.121042 Transcript_67979/m.121042 type:complete len:99 (+) Transcript_67979:709-1005(+)